MDPDYRHQKIPMRMSCPRCGELVEELEEAGTSEAVRLYLCTACPWSTYLHSSWAFWEIFASQSPPRG